MEVALRIQGREQQQILQVAVDSEGILLGRGWNCAAILSDSRVDAEHARLQLGPDGTLQVSDLDSVNGTRLNGASVNGSPTLLTSGSTLTLGRTEVTVYDQAHPVPAARKPSLLDSIKDNLNQPGTVLLLTVFCLVASVGAEYLGFAGQYKLEDFVQQLLSALLVGVVWTLFWAAVGKMTRGEAQLLPNWSLAMLASALFAIGGELAPIVGFNAQSATVQEATEVVINLISVVAVLALALSINTNLGRRGRILLALVPAGLLLTTGTIMPRLDDDKPVNAPPALLISQPPWLKAGSDADAGEFLERSAELFERTAQDARRRVEKAQAGL